MVIGIGGSSNSGKSTLAKQLSSYYKDISVKVLCQDDFVKRRDYLTTINEHVDWEVPSTIEIEKYINAVIDAKNKYKLVICEGLFAFWFEELNKLYDKKIFLKINELTFKERKSKDFRWGKEPNWYINHIWESHLRYCEIPFKKNKYFIIDASKKINIEELVKFIDIP